MSPMSHLSLILGDCTPAAVFLLETQKQGIKQVSHRGVSVLDLSPRTLS